MTVPFIHSLTLGAPWWLAALALVPILAAVFTWGEHRRVQLLQRLVAARLQPALAGSVSLAKRRLHFALVLTGLACFALALTQPRYGYTVEQAKRKGRDVLIAVDTSRSMLANDVKPNRLERAKFAAQDLINALEGDRLGLVAFAGSAFLQAPLTVDYTAIFSALSELDTQIIPLGGTNIAEAIRTATDAFGKGESESRCLVLFTDGEDLGTDAIEAARKAAGTMRIFTVGVGSADGSLIPVPGENGGTQFVKGADGQFVKSRLDEKMLAGIAEATGGFYSRLQNGPADMHRLVAEGLGKMKQEEIDARLSHRPIERYQWPLGLGIALIMASAFINERRRKSLKGATALALFVVALAATPRPASAATSEELYQQQRFDEARKQYEEALKLQPDSAELHFNKGATDFQLDDYENAIAEFSKALRSSDPQLQCKAEYNLGTTLLNRALKEQYDTPQRKTDFKNAQEHLKQALQLNPNYEKAKTNKKIADHPEPKPTPPPDNKDKKQDDKKDQKKDDKDQQSKDQQSKDQQSKDQQSKDQQSKDQQSKDQQSKDQQSKDQQSKDQQSKDQQSKDQQSKDQQSKDQQSKDQQSKDQQSKDQQSKDQQSKDQQSKDQQSKDQQSKDQQSKDQQSKDQQSKDQQSKDQQSKDQQSKDQQAQQGATPPPASEEKKLSGEIKANDSKPDENQEQQAQAEAPAKPGEMSPNQARAVLDSLKGEDGQPFKMKQKSAAPVLKDW